MKIGDRPGGVKREDGDRTLPQSMQSACMRKFAQGVVNANRPVIAAKT
jgi:hypothetical protein